MTRSARHRVGQLLREGEVGPTVAEERRADDDVRRAGVEHLAGAIDGADPAANATGPRPAGVPDQRVVAARSDRRVEIDQLQLGEAGEPRNPPVEVRVLERQPLALHELHDLLAAQVDRRNQHESYCLTGMPRACRWRFSPDTLCSA